MCDRPSTEAGEEVDPGAGSGTKSVGLGHVVSRGIAELLVWSVKLYQITLGPFLGGRCRFEPSCSYYFIEAVRKHGPVRGACKGIWRICRCQPFYPGGYDPP